MVADTAKHGHCRRVDGVTVQSPTYQSYRSMLDRCYRSKHPRFARYGGRDALGGVSISVCSRWRFGEGDLSGFECFLVDMGVRPSIDYTLDRKHHDDDYEPTRCQWATVADQNNNKSNNKFITIGDETLSLARWVDKFDKRVHYSQILRRIWAGDDPTKALMQSYSIPKKRKPKCSATS